MISYSDAGDAEKGSSDGDEVDHFCGVGCCWLVGWLVLLLLLLLLLVVMLCDEVVTCGRRRSVIYLSVNTFYRSPSVDISSRPLCACACIADRTSTFRNLSTRKTWYNSLHGASMFAK